jgi:elongation factor Ts
VAARAGLASAAKRADREASEGAVAVVRDGNVAAMVELRCETDFVAKSEEFVSWSTRSPRASPPRVTDVVSQFENIEKMLTTLKENISIGRVYRLEAGEGEVVDTYIHHQAGRGVNAVIVVVKGANEEVAHEIAVHIAFAKPLYLNARGRAPERGRRRAQDGRGDLAQRGQARGGLPKIIEGRLNGWFKDRVLLEQPYVKDEKQTVAAVLGAPRSRRSLKWSSGDRSSSCAAWS